MKKTYSTPKLAVHGSVDLLTQQTKTFGADDGLVLAIPGVPNSIPIGDS